MAVVYLARQVDLDRLVALKELEAFRARDPSFGQRFLRESRLAGSLSHPNVVTVFDYFEQTRARTSRWSTSRRVAASARRQDEPAADHRCVRGPARALAHSESRHVVHRDLKPENVMISAEGHIKVADFGIAKAYDQVATGDFMTSTGTTVGTPTYMAPEQAMGSNIGPWTDLYSAGVMAYELFVGQLPFPAAATPMAMLLHHINDPVPEPRELNPELHPDLERWILGLLDKTPEKRTGSAMEAWETLEEVALGLFGPRWRRQARLLELAGPEAPAEPLTPAPFESAPHKSPGQLDVVPVVPPDPESSFVTFDPPARAPTRTGAGRDAGAAAGAGPAPEPEPEPPAPVEPGCRLILRR